MESNIFLKIIKYIRVHKDRITIIGIDNDKIDRDYDMYKIIIKNYKLSNDNLLYIKNKNHKWFLGHYLKKELKDDYCIILSQAYEGINRFNSYCMGNNCEERTFQLKYFYKKFKYDKNKKYFNLNKKYQLLTNYTEPLILFSNSYYKENKYGV